MATHLRLIALTVDEPSPGLFQWSLLESSKPPLYDRPVLAAEEPYDSFEKAARAGLLNWTRMAGDDPRRGPRSREESLPLEPVLAPDLETRPLDQPDPPDPDRRVSAAAPARAHGTRKTTST